MLDAAESAVAASALALARRFDLDLAGFGSAAPRLFGAGPVGEVPESLKDTLDTVTAHAAPDALGAIYEGRLSSAHRKAKGVVFTPRAVADGLVAAATDDIPADRLCGWRVLDPACGGGAFLLAAARRLAALDVPIDEIIAERLWGIDIDPGAAAVTEASLALWAALSTRHVRRSVSRHLLVSDALLDPDPFPGLPGDGFDLVVGNPPFLGQLSDATRHDAERREALQDRWGGLVRSYTDPAVLFLAAGREMLAPGGRMALVQPMSVLGARDAAPSRRAALADARLHGLWLAPEPVFGTSVRTCAPVIAAAETRTGVGLLGAARNLLGFADDAADERAPDREAEDLDVRRWAGPDVRPIESAAPRTYEPAAPAARPATGGVDDGEGWASLALDVLGVPTVTFEPRSRGPEVVGDLATATAGFRDQFYGLVPFVREAPAHASPREYAPLITSGLIDPGVHSWGHRPTRFAGTRWSRPVVDLGPLRENDPGLAQWVEARRRPKVLLATQTKVLEAVPDPLGVMVPSVPVVSIEPFHPGDVPGLAAALASPPLTSWAFELTAGTALSADAIKLAASQVLAAPLPADDAAWAEAAKLLTPATLEEFAVVATEAYGLARDHPVVGWWLDRVGLGGS